MRIRTILAAAAAPAALAAVLLGTAGQASAAVVKVAPVTVTANTHQHDVADTTSLPAPPEGVSSQQQYPAIDWSLPSSGPVWAHDNLERTITATRDEKVPTLWHVTVASNGSFNAVANPLTGAAWSGGSGSVKGWVKYDVTTTNPTVMPSGKHLPAQSGATLRSADLAVGLFPAGQATVTGAPAPGDQYLFDYNPIPGGGSGPNGLTYEQVG